jgi:hypothetical protein
LFSGDYASAAAEIASGGVHVINATRLAVGLNNRSSVAFSDATTENVESAACVSVRTSVEVDPVAYVIVVVVDEARSVRMMFSAEKRIGTVVDTPVTIT